MVQRLFQVPGLFVLLGLLAGGGFIFLTPPLQQPDEEVHFLRAYEISEGRLVPRWTGGAGGDDLPVALARVVGLFGYLCGNSNRHITFADIASTLAIPIQPGNRANFDFTDAAKYAPLAYLPQAIGMAVGRLFTSSAVAMIYWGRSGNLLVYLVLGYLSLRWIPIAKLALLLLLFMPMSLCLAASLSPDSLTIALATLATAIITRLALAEQPEAQRLSAWLLIALALVTAMLSLTKIAYLPMLGLLLCIPRHRFGRAGRWATALLLILAFNLLVVWLWVRQTPGIRIASNPSMHPDPARQLALLVHHPLWIARIVVGTAHRFGFFILVTYTGRLAWLEVNLTLGFVLIYIAAMLLACWPQRDAPQAASARRFAGPIVASLCAATLAILLLNYLFWTPVGRRWVEGIQGRYFIPLSAPALLLVAVLAGRLPPRWQINSSHPWTLATGAFAFASLTYALAAMCMRFYG